jgi:ABC-type Fe3+-hydroxamate transport system substrate-binding protein
VNIVSLVPSATETLLAWRVTPVAVTRFCEQPALLAVGGTKDPDIDAVIALRPDLVVLCEEENRLEDAAALGAAGLATHVIRIDSVEDVEPELARLAAAVGVDRAPADAIPPAPVATATAVMPIWRRPWMTVSGGTYGSSVLAHLGVANVFADAAERYPAFTFAEAAALAPDVVIAPSEPYPFKERHRDELEQLAPVVLVDGQDLFWWGVRTASALARLRRTFEAAQLEPVTATRSSPRPRA